MDNIKSGMKTTEFWITLIGLAASAYATTQGIPIPTEVTAGGAGVVIAYIAGRTFLKHRAAEIAEDAPEPTTKSIGQ